MNAEDSRQPALERLAISRERIRLSLQEAAHPQAGRGDGKPSLLMSALLAIPGAHIVVGAVRHWWAQHPMRLAGTLAANTAQSVVWPIARRKPFVLVLGAMAAGGVLFWLKPWRGFVRPALLAGLLPQIVSRAISQVPIESWLATLLTMVTLRARSHDDEPEEKPPGAPDVATQNQDHQDHQDRPASTTLH